MKTIEETIDEMAQEYAERERGLGFIGEISTEKAFKVGAKFALSHQWMSVDDALPEEDEDVLALAITSKNQRAGLARCYKCSNGTVKWVSDDINADYIRYWMQILPLPEINNRG